MAIAASKFESLELQGVWWGFGGINALVDLDPDGPGGRVSSPCSGRPAREVHRVELPRGTAPAHPRRS